MKESFLRNLAFRKMLIKTIDPLTEEQLDMIRQVGVVIAKILQFVIQMNLI